MNDQDHLADSIREAMNLHGHSFQWAVVNRLRQRELGTSGWSVDSTEFPVEVNGTPLHIDAVLAHPMGYMLLECKRANPALSWWCFGRSNAVAAHVKPRKSGPTRS